MRREPNSSPAPTTAAALVSPRPSPSVANASAEVMCALLFRISHTLLLATCYPSHPLYHSATDHSVVQRPQHVCVSCYYMCETFECARSYFYGITYFTTSCPLCKLSCGLPPEASVMQKGACTGGGGAG